MTNAQPDCSEVCVAPPPAVIAALRDLYIVSSAAAQRGAYALEVRDAHWRALARGIQEAKAVLDPQIATRETHATALLRQLASMCEDLLDRHATLWAFDDNAYALLCNVLMLHDQQLGSTPLYALKKANDQLQQHAAKAAGQDSASMLTA
jgi:hypothetical protein